MPIRRSDSSVDEVLALVGNRCQLFADRPVFKSDPNLRAIVEALRSFRERKRRSSDIENLIKGIKQLLETHGKCRELESILTGNCAVFGRLIQRPV